MHNYLTKKKGGVCPSWMSKNVHDLMMKNARDDEAFRARSQNASKNRRGGSLDAPVQPSHCMGSISTSERAKKLASEKGGILPTAAELYLDTHMREVQGQGKVPISDRVREIRDAYEQNLARSQQSGAEPDPNKIYYETVGGRKRGQVPGLGTSGDMYFERPSRRVGAPSTSATPTIIAQLSQRVAAYDDQRLALESQRLAVESQRLAVEEKRLQAATKERDEYVARLEAALERYAHLFPDCSSSGSPLTPPGDPRDPPGAGGSGACAV